MAADCKSALLRVRWFESSPLHQTQGKSFLIGRTAVKKALVVAVGHPCGCSSMVELKPSKLMTRVRFPSPAPRVFVGRGRISGCGQQVSPFSSVVEHSLGKGEATCSIHVKGTRFFILVGSVGRVPEHSHQIFRSPRWQKASLSGRNRT